MISKRLGAVSMVVALLGAAACGSSAKKVDPAADLATAKSAVLTAADLPGYTSTPYKQSDDLPAAAKKDFADCMKSSISIFEDTPGEQKVNSPNFDKGEAEVQNTVEILPKRSQVDATWAQISKDSATPCIQKLFESAIKASAADTPGATFSGTKVSRFDVGVGGQSVGFAVTLTVSAQGRSFPFYADVVFIQRDRAELSLFYSGLGTPPERAFETSLAQKVYDRVGTKAS